MHSVAFVFACLVCASVGRRAQSTLSRSRGSHAAVSNKPILSIDVTSNSQSNCHPLEDLADFLRACHVAAAFQPITTGPTLAMKASQAYHAHACRLPRRSRRLYLQEVERTKKRTPQQKLLDELQAASKVYRSNEEAEPEPVSRRGVLGPLGVALGAVLGYSFSSKQTTESTSKEKAIKSELTTLKSRIREEDVKLKERPSSTKVQRNDRDAELKETQRRLEETEALWSLAVEAATNTEKELRDKDQQLAGLGILGVVQAVVTKQNMDAAAEATSKLEAAKEAKKIKMEKVATEFEAAMSKEAALYTAAVAANQKLEAVEAEKKEALEKAEAAMEAAVMSNEAALQEATSEATKQLEAMETAKQAALKNAARLAAQEQELKAAVEAAREAASAKRAASAASKKAAVEVAELEDAAKSIMLEVVGQDAVDESSNKEQGLASGSSSHEEGASQVETHQMTTS